MRGAGGGAGECRRAEEVRRVGSGLWVGFGWAGPGCAALGWMGPRTRGRGFVRKK